MKLLVDALGWIAVLVAIGVGVFVAVMSIYLIKNAKWEANLSRYTIDGDSVINPYGFEINARQLLEELKGIEEEICKKSL